MMSTPLHARCYPHLFLLILFFLAGLLFLQVPVASAQAPPGQAALLTVIKLRDGMESLFEAGYRRHLDWHRDRADFMPWYGWYVITGERRGYFVDGTFGHSWSALDQRVDPAGDRRDNTLNVLPYVEAIFTRVLMLRSDLSTARFLEEQATPRRLQTFSFYLKPGTEHRFDEALRILRSALLQAESPPALAWYQLIEGGEYPNYLLMIPRTDWASYDTTDVTLTALINRALPSEQATDILQTINEVVQRVYSETLSYRADLSYFPGAQ